MRMITIDENIFIGCGLCAKDCFTKDKEVIGQKAKSIECGHCIELVLKKTIILENYLMSEILKYAKADLN